MPKLTLSVDERVISRAKRYARQQGTSVSRLVEKMLDVAAAPTPDKEGVPPVLSRLRGSLKRGNAREYQRYLEQKYR